MEENNMIEPYKENGIIRDRPPRITKKDIAKQKKRLEKNGYNITDGFLEIVNKANKHEYATYDIYGKKVNFTDGYFASFQVNKAIGVHRDYTMEEYDLYVYECMERTDSLPYLGYYGNAEMSFHTNSLQTAVAMAVDFNQKSIYDIANGIERYNEFYNKDTNPTED